MSVNLSPVGGAGAQFFDNNGNPLSGGRLYTYAAGTTTPQTTYTTSTGNVAQPNPIVLDAAGRVPGSSEIWLTAGITYKFVLMTSTNVVLATWDNISGINSFLGIYSITVKDFGAVGDGIADDTAAINTAFSAMNAGQFKVLYFPEGVYKVTGPLTTITANGACLIGAAGSASCRIEQTSSTASTLTFSPTNPSSSRISDVCLENITIWNSSTAPTSGVALTIIRADRMKVTNLDIRNHFVGLDVVGGGDQLWVNVDVAGPYTWTSVATGSRCVRIRGANYGSVFELPSEIFLTNFNFKGASNSGNLYLQSALEISACDGLWLANGHVGFSDGASCFIRPSGSGFYIQNIEFVNVYFDGNLSGTANSGVLIIQDAAYAIEDVKFTGCLFQNHTDHGIQVTGSGGLARRIKVEGGVIRNNRKFGVILGADDGSSSCQQISIINVNICDNNISNTSASAIVVNDGVQGVRVQNCLIEGVSYDYQYGVLIDALAQNVSVQNNQFYKCTTPILNSGASVTQYGGNQLQWAAPTVASAAALPLLQGFDYVVVTGTTNITSISGANIPLSRVLLFFTGALTVFDGNNIQLNGGVNFVTANASILELVNDGSAWREISRSSF